MQASSKGSGILNHDIDEMVKSCAPSPAHQFANKKETLIPHDVPKHIDDIICSGISAIPSVGTWIIKIRTWCV